MDLACFDNDHSDCPVEIKDDAGFLQLKTVTAKVPKTDRYQTL